MISEQFEGREQVSIITCDRCGMTISDDGSPAGGAVGLDTAGNRTTGGRM